MKNIITVIFLLSLNYTMSAHGSNNSIENTTDNMKEYFNSSGYFLFDKFITSLNSSIEKKTLIDKFLGFVKEGKYPLFENDSTSVLLYNGEQDSVGVIGDMSNWTDILWMEKLEKTSLHYLKMSAEKDARFEYWFMFGKNSFPALDTLNPYKGLSGFGEVSELAMPCYKRHPYFNDYLHGKKGSAENLKEHVIASKKLEYDHTIHVYLPPHYTVNKSYPSVYFQDGIDYVEFAQVPVILDNMILEGKIQPLVAVFVTPPNRLKAGMPNRMTEYGMNDKYVEFFTDELVTFIDSNYSTLRDPHMRLVTGDSFGGLISAYIPFKRPDVFTNGYSQSGYHSFNMDKLINLFRTEDKKPISLYIDTGIYERNVGASFLPKEETDFLLANRRMKTTLEEKSYKFIYKEYAEGHTWGNWKRHLIDALQYFFPNLEGEYR